MEDHSMKALKITGCLFLVLCLGQTSAWTQDACTQNARTQNAETLNEGIPSSNLTVAERIKIQPALSPTPSQASLPQVSNLPFKPASDNDLFQSSFLWGDIDNDGLKDVFVLDVQGNRLYHNLGDGSFEDLTALVFPHGAGKWTQGLFKDFNRDGRLDLFVYSQKGCTLYRNDDYFCFSDVTLEVGLNANLSGTFARYMDFDCDGFDDLLFKSLEGDRLFHNQGGLTFSEVTLGKSLQSGIPSTRNPSAYVDPSAIVVISKTESAASNNESVSNNINHEEGSSQRNDGFGTWLDHPIQGNGRGKGPTSETMLSTPPVGELGGPFPEDPELPAAGITADMKFLNDNSPGSVGEGIPEVEGGDDGTTDNDIVDGTVVGVDIQGDSVSADKIIGTAATLTGNQNFDSGTLYIDAANNRVGVGTTTPSSSSLHVVGSSTYGTRSETSSTSGQGVYGEATAATGAASGVKGESASTSGRGIHGYASATSGLTFGVIGESESDNGIGIYALAPRMGIYGVASDKSEIAYGISGFTSSSSGTGVYGSASASTGETNGVYGRNGSESGRGVYGYADSTSGLAFGVHGVSDSTGGRGVYGVATALTGTNYGVRGRTYSESGRGVYGAAITSSGTNYGVKGFSSSPDGYGVFGECQNIGIKGRSTSSSSGNCYGVYGEVLSDLMSVAGVCGIASTESEMGRAKGVYGETSSKIGVGVYGYATHDGTHSHADGVLGITDSEEGTGVYGLANNDYGEGVKGWTPSPDGYGVYSDGNFKCTGLKMFSQPHPTDASKEIRFVCLEGNESGTYFRGTSKLQNGEAVIEVPEEFRLVTEPEGLTVQCTPSGPAQIWYEKMSLEQIVVRGDMDVEFHYFVNGVRRGFTDIKLVRENHAWVPEFRGKPFGMQFPEALRKILVENGILNADFTPNESMASKMGWELCDFETVYPCSVGSKENASLDNPNDEDYIEPERKADDVVLPIPFDESAVK